MIDLECPFCGRVGSVPREKANTRLVCKKCHMIFHMGPTGRALPGEPPTQRTADHGHAHAHAPAAVKESGVSLPSLGDLNSGLLGVLGVLIVLAVIYLGYSWVGRGGTASLVPVAERMAEALKANDLKTIKELAAPESAGEAANWYESARRTADELKKSSSGRDVHVTAVVTDENPARGSGQVEIFLIPTQGVARNQQIATEAGTAAKSSELTTFWTLSGGKWWFDAKRTVSGSGGAG